MSIPITRKEPFELPLLLLLGFRAAIEDLHQELARQGHPEVRPLHGFVLQAVGRGATTAAELGRRLDVSRQAAGTMIDRLERMAYLERFPDPRDARKREVRLSARGVDCLRRSDAILRRLRERWAERLGPDRLDDMERVLRELVPREALPLDLPGWFGAAGEG